jgi:transposase
VAVPLFVRRLTAKEKKTLLALGQQKTQLRLQSRARAVLLSAQGRRVPQIAAHLNVSDTTVQRWFHRFNQHGLAGLFPGKSPGRPPKSTGTIQRTIRTLLRKPPQAFGYKAQHWNASLLTRQVQRRHRVRLHPETVRRFLKTAGLWSQLRSVQRRGS